MEVVTSSISAPAHIPSPLSPVQTGGLVVQGTTHWVGALLAKVPWGSAPKGFPFFPEDTASLPRPSSDRLQSFQSPTESRLLDLGGFVTVCFKKAM